MKQHLDEFSINYAATYYVFHYHICKDTTAIITLITTQLSTGRHEPIGCTSGKWNIYIFQIMTSHLLGANSTPNLILTYCHLELLTTQLKFWFTKYTLFYKNVSGNLVWRISASLLKRRVSIQGYKMYKEAIHITYRGYLAKRTLSAMRKHGG